MNAGQQVRDDPQQLAFVDGAAPQFEIHVHMFRDRRGGLETLDIVWARIHYLLERFDVGPVAQGLNPAGRGAGADREQGLRLLSHEPNAMRVLFCGDRPFNQREIVRAWVHGAGGFWEIGNL